MGSVLALAAVAAGAEQSCSSGCVSVEMHVYSVEPQAGSLLGGTRLIVRGSGFRDFGSFMRCRFGEQEVAASLSASPGEWLNPNNHTQMSCESPRPQRVDEHSVDFSVSLSGNEWSADAVRYEYFRMPVLLALSPERGSAAEPPLLTITRDAAVHSSAWRPGAPARCRFTSVEASSGRQPSFSAETSATIVDESEVLCLAPQRDAVGPSFVELSLNGRDFTTDELSYEFDDHWHLPAVSGGAPSGREGAAVAAANGQLFVLGGIDGAADSSAGFQADMYVLHTDVIRASYADSVAADLQWQKLSLLLNGGDEQPRGARASLSAWGGNLILFGGVSSWSGDSSSRVFQFHLASQSWRALSTGGGPVAARSAHSALLCTVSGGCTALDGRPKLFVFGGWGLAECGRARPCYRHYNDLWELDLNAMEWREVRLSEGSEAPWARKGHVAARFNGSKMIVWGGAAWTPDADADNSFGATQRHANDLWHIDLSGADGFTWHRTEAVGEAPSAREGAASVMLGGRWLVVQGGYCHMTGGGGFLSDTYVLDTARQPMVWMKPLLSGRAPSARQGHSAVLIEGGEAEEGRYQVHFFGGSSRIGYHNDIHVLQLDEIELELGAEPLERQGFRVGGGSAH